MFRTSPGRRGNSSESSGSRHIPLPALVGMGFYSPATTRQLTLLHRRLFRSAELVCFANKMKKKPNPAPKPLFPAPAEFRHGSAERGRARVSVPLGQRDLGRFRGSSRSHSWQEDVSAAPPRPRVVLIITAFGQGWLPPAPQLPERNILLRLGELQVTFCKEGETTLGGQATKQTSTGLWLFFTTL